MTIEEIIKTGASVNWIVLSPLDLSTVTQLISDTLNCGEKEINYLAELVFTKTGGNPFFMNEFLNSLYRERLLNFNLISRKWEWNIEQLQEKDFTDNVVDLMLLKIQKLPENTQETLKIAACTGNEFELKALASICQKSLQETVESLHAAIAENLVVPLGNMGDVELMIAEKLPSTQPLEYKFVHDRIQQAAYSLIAEQEKPLVHRQIGKMLLQNLPIGRREEKIFDIVNQLNFATSLITDQSERDELAQFNLLAGKKAKASAAYEPAFNYLQVGLNLLGETGWQSQYKLTLSLHEEAAEVAYILGKFEQMEALVTCVLQNAKTVLDKVKVYELKIEICITQNNFIQGIDIGIEVLNSLKVCLPQSPSNLYIKVEFENLINLPNMTDPESLAAMSILGKMIAIGYVGIPELLVPIVLTQIDLSIKYGNAPKSSFAYATYGVILCTSIQDIEAGYKYGKLGLRLVEKLNAKHLKAGVLDTFGNHILHWKEHLKGSLSILKEAYCSAVETGNIDFIGYSTFDYCFNAYSVGCELRDLEKEFIVYYKILTETKNKTCLTWLAMYVQIIFNLLGKAEDPTQLLGEFYDEEQFLPLQIESSDRQGLFLLYLNKLMLCYLFGKPHEAAKNAALAQPYLDGVPGMAAIPLFHFYDSLAHLSTFADSSNFEQEIVIKRVGANQEKMQIWADHAPMNYLHKFYLVEAEKARIIERFLEAIDYYDRAISLAKEHEYIQEAALAYELAAKFYLSREKELIAKAYMQEARYCYQLWGAVAKVKDLETRYLQLFAINESATKAITTMTSITGSHSSSSLDIATVMKASEAISGEIILDKLLSKLMKILSENVGAQIGYLILDNQGKLVIEAECALDCEKVTVLQSIPVDNCQNLAESIVSYVARTKEKVVLNDATCEGQFTNDPYIKNIQPKSILCAALMNQGQVSAIVYLENRLTAQAFTPERLELLQLLSGQAAIAITNAKLYAEVKERESRLTQFIDAMPIGVAVHDTTGQITYANQTAHQLSGINIIPKATTEQFAEACQLYQAGTHQLYPTPKLPHVRSLEGETVKVDDMELHQPDKIISLEVSSTPIVDETGKVNYAIATFQDITERKQAEKLLADYNLTLEKEITERTLQLIDQNILQERNRMAREIHDTLAQAFTGILVHLAAAKRAMTRDLQQALTHIQTVRELAKNGLHEAKRSVEALRPQLLENSDLSTALNYIATQMLSHTGTSTMIEVIGTIYPLPPEVENNFLRIGQEALTNAFKYAKANTIQVGLIYETKQFSLRVQDDGHGFDRESPCFSNGFGFLGMQERADRIGAKLTINSQLGKGTEVIVSINRE